MLINSCSPIYIPIGNNNNNDKGKRNNEVLTIKGRSRAGDGTCYIVQELKWMFDCGAPIVNWIPNIIFITHTHSDHILNLTNILFNKTLQQSSKVMIHIYLPKIAVPLLQKYLNSFQELIECQEQQSSIHDNNNETSVDAPTTEVSATTDCNNKKQDTTTNYVLHGMVPNETVQLPTNKGYYVTAIQCYHRIDCLGYSTSKEYSQLKKEYQTMNGKEINQLCKDGIEVKEYHIEYLFVFLGDTTHEVFIRNPNILLQHKYIFIECTFLNDDEENDDDKINNNTIKKLNNIKKKKRTNIERAEETMHMHWKYLQSYIINYPNILFFISHLSLRYNPLQIRQFFHQYRNIHPILIEYEIKQEWLHPSNGGNNNRNKNKSLNQNNNHTFHNIPKCHCFLCIPDSKPISLNE